MKLMENEQKELWYLDNINPNGRIPAITDTYDDGNQIRVFESGAVMEYLVDRYDKDYKISYPKNSREHWETISWVCLDLYMPHSNLGLTLKFSSCGRWVA
jgi:glutathione S-transferase